MSGSWFGGELREGGKGRGAGRGGVGRGRGTYMWTLQRCACLAGSGGELVRGNGQCDGRGMVMVERVQLQRRRRWKGWVEAKVAVGDSGRQARLLTEGVEASTSTSKGCLEFATGRLPDNVDRSTGNQVKGVATQKGRVVVIAGPTAVGKSRVAIALAKELGGEIISADSIQVGLTAIVSHTPLLICVCQSHHRLQLLRVS